MDGRFFAENGVLSYGIFFAMHNSFLFTLDSVSKRRYIWIISFIMKKAKSTFERVMSDPKQKKAFEKEYVNFLLSELLLDAMAQQDISVRALSKASGISTSVIQNLRAMQPVNVTLKTLNALLSTLGYELVARKGRHCVNLSTP
jgi:DNA-binding Xre family transcriptional regulator